MGWIGSVRCEKFQCDFMPRTCTLNPPFQPTLYRVSRSNETIQNVPKHYGTHQNMSLGSDGVDRVRLLRTVPMRLHGTNLCINSTISAHFASSFMQRRNNPKCSQTLQNAAIHEFRVPWSGYRCIRCEKFQNDFMAQTCALIALVQPVLHRVLHGNQTVPDAPK